VRAGIGWPTNHVFAADQVTLAVVLCFNRLLELAVYCKGTFANKIFHT